MRLESLRLEQLPGLRSPIVIDGLSAGLVLVVGPNGSGKSSLARGMRHLLWDDGRTVEEVGEARWRTALGVIEARRDPLRGLRFQPQAPTLPGEEHADLYFLSPEGFGAGRGRETLERRLRLELAQGFDLASALAEVRAGDGPLALRRPRVERDQAKRDVEVERARQRHLEDERKQLASLEREIAQAREAGEQLGRWERALAARELEPRIAELRARLAELPPLAGRLREEDRTDAQDLVDRIASLDARLAWKQKELDELRASPDATPLKAGVSEFLDSLRVEWRGLEKQRQQAEAEVRRLASDGRKLLAELGLEEPPAVTLGARDQLTDLLRRREQHAGREPRGIHPGDEREPEAAARAARALEDWLAARAPDPARMAAFFAAVLAAALLWAGALVAWGGGRGGLALGLALCGVVAALLCARGLFLMRARGRVAAARFEAEGFEAPAAWRPGEVQRRLAELGARMEAQRRALEQHGTWSAQASAIERELVGWFAQHRIDRDPGAAGLERWPRTLERLEECERERAAAESRAREASEHWSEVRRRFADVLGAEFEATGADSWDLQEADAAWRERAKRLAQHHSRIRETEQSRRELEQEREGLRNRWRQLLTRLGLDEARGLAELCAADDARAEWNRIARHLHELELEQRSYGPEAGHPDRFEDLDAAALRARIAEVREQADQYEDLVERRSAIRAKVERAEVESPLEAALARLRAAEDQLAERVGDLLLGASAAWLVSDVEHEYGSHPRGELLARADVLLRAFTLGRFHLSAPRTGDEGEKARGFGVRTDREEVREPSVLSSGTQAQLELALRLAAIERIEAGGAPLPLFLDEVLTHADPGRFDAVADALVKIAAEGRQVFFASADPVDAWRMEEAARRAGVEPPARVILGADTPPPADVALLAAPRRRPVPAPAGLDAESYAARLGVPALDAFAPPEAAHPWHLWRDELELVQRFELAQVRDVGHLERLLTARGEAFLPSEVAAQFATRLRVLRACLEAWRIGRARPFTALELQNSPASSSSKADELMERAEESGFDAARFLAALENKQVANLRTKLVGALREHFDQLGCLADGEPLEGEALMQRALELARPADLDERARFARWIDWHLTHLGALQSRRGEARAAAEPAGAQGEG